VGVTYLPYDHGDNISLPGTWMVEVWHEESGEQICRVVLDNPWGASCGTCMFHFNGTTTL
jgi:hypothetical protein